MASARSLLVVLVLFAAAACGSNSDDTNQSTASPDDDSISVDMEICFNNTMTDVGMTSGVDTASDSELNAALQTTLMLCGNKAIKDDAIGSGYTCNTDGCYDNTDNGYPWTQMATRWACTKSAEMCDAARNNG